MALTYSSTVIIEHARYLEEHIEELKRNLANRGAVPDITTYHYLVGKIDGLREALELCDDAVRKINES